MAFTLHEGNCLDVMRTMADNSVDSIVTDPPYGLSFMGKKWDYDVPSAEVWREALRVLKPGGHLLAFAGSRTYHRMAVNIEDAGFEIRDQIMWLYGSGFPKSLDVSKAIDKAAGAERIVTRKKVEDAATWQGNTNFSAISSSSRERRDNPVTDEAKQWQGWGTALKPAHEPICVARKPLIGTVAANVLQHGTGALNIDGCRVAIDLNADASQLRTMNVSQHDGLDGWGMNTTGPNPCATVLSTAGRWPANLIHDGSDEVLAAFPQAPGQQRAVGAQHGVKDSVNVFGDYGPRGDAGSAARFFYCAKTSKKDRDEGLDGFAQRTMDVDGAGRNQAGFSSADRPATQPRANTHLTVKPTPLMRYLCRLVTSPGGVVLDPFTGSGSTGKAAVLEGFQFVGIELDPEYVQIARARIEHALGLDIC